MTRRHAIVTVALILVGLGPAVADDDRVLATVGEQRVTVSDLTREMARRPGDWSSAESRRHLLESLLEQRALVEAAYRAGYAEDPEIRDVIERLMISRLEEDVLERRLREIEISDAEVMEFFEANRDRYAQPERRQVAVIRIDLPFNASPEKHAEIEARAEQALVEAGELPSDVTHFGEVAVAYSDDRGSRYRGGVVGWLVRHPDRRSNLPEPIEQAAFELEETGEIGPVVEAEGALWLIRLVTREAAQPRPLAAVEKGIRHQLMREKTASIEAEFRQEILQSVEVEIHEDLLVDVPAPESKDDPPALPGS